MRAANGDSTLSGTMGLVIRIPDNGRASRVTFDNEASDLQPKTDAA
jgi:hypothetical protein